MSIPSLKLPKISFFYENFTLWKCLYFHLPTPNSPVLIISPKARSLLLNGKMWQINLFPSIQWMLMRLLLCLCAAELGKEENNHSFLFIECNLAVVWEWRAVQKQLVNATFYQIKLDLRNPSSHPIQWVKCRSLGESQQKTISLSCTYVSLVSILFLILTHYLFCAIAYYLTDHKIKFSVFP